jgi:hypothetical protein
VYCVLCTVFCVRTLHPSKTHARNETEGPTRKLTIRQEQYGTEQGPREYTQTRPASLRRSMTWCQNGKCDIVYHTSIPGIYYYYVIFFDVSFLCAGGCTGSRTRGAWRVVCF